MAKALDGHRLQAHCPRLAFTQEAREMIVLIRGSRLGGNLSGIRGSTYVGYPSKKMGRIIRAESGEVEFPSILELEYRSEYEVDF